MTYRLDTFADAGLTEATLGLVLDEHRRGTLPRLHTLWTYYRNALRPVGIAGSDGQPTTAGRWYRLAQEIGLPTRIVGAAGTLTTASNRRDVVVENDIGWRVQAMVDFMFGKPIKLRSTARDAGLRDTIDRALDAVWERSGGIALLQDAALLGNVFGHVDLLLRIDDAFVEFARHHRPHGPSQRDDNADRLDRIMAALDHVHVEIVDPRRGVPVLDERDYRRINAYVIQADRPRSEPRGAGPLASAADALAGAVDRILLRRGRVEERPARAATRHTTSTTEIISAAAWQIYDDGRLVWEREHADLTAGQIPVVHVQNVSQPFEYAGLSEVEPLIPLQDELNTRLSDRANRVALQSFKMYLAKGIDGFEKCPVTPGTIWSTDNPDASIETFGGDAHSPSEEQHILEVREAMDKVSGVPPIASGVVRAKIGNLSSANALRITLMGVLSKTARKRITYGRGIARLSSMVLAALDATGLLSTSPADRGVAIDWPDPLPEDKRETIWAAQAKAKLGVPERDVLKELGATPVNTGIE